MQPPLGREREQPLPRGTSLQQDASRTRGLDFLRVAVSSAANLSRDRHRRRARDRADPNAMVRGVNHAPPDVFQRPSAALMAA